MGKNFKNFVNFSILGFLGYIGYKLFSKVKGAIELDKTLSQYLENLFGEKPISFNVNLELSGTNLDVVFSKKIIDENENIEQIIRDYVRDFYPMFKDENLKIKISALPEKTD